MLSVAVLVCSSSLLLGQNDELPLEESEATPPFNALLATADQRREYLQQMTTVEKNRLRRQLERFEELDRDEQQRLRALQKDLATAPDRDELMAVMRGYHSWLDGLSTADRAAFLARSPEDRINYLREVKATEARRASDRRAIGRWIEEQLVKHLPPDVQQRLAQVDGELRQFRLADELMRERERNRRPTWLLADEEDFKVLEASLSDEARKRLEGQSLQKKRFQLAYWIKEYADVHLGEIPHMEMRRFYRELPEEERRELRRKFSDLSPEEVRDQLELLYLEKNPYNDRAFFEGRSFGRSSSSSSDRRRAPSRDRSPEN
ncbi:Uncharacterized protein SCF082_LOCUS28831 [Durusdinium trenchii]|uniref:DUF3106 domain-containing protein n=1 Tax=Durusdinium trenchii TaxID=1381693 RepID=A0ABP0MNS0_9DINO